MLNDVNDDPDLLKSIITSDGSWIYSYGDFAHSFLRLSRRCASRIPTTRSYSKRRVLLWSFMVFTWIVKKKTARKYGKKNSWILYHDNPPAHKWLLVSNFLTKNHTPSCLRHRIHQTYPPANFLSSKNWKGLWKDEDLPWLRILKLHRWRSSRQYPKFISKVFWRLEKALVQVHCIRGWLFWRG